MPWHAFVVIVILGFGSLARADTGGSMGGGSFHSSSSSSNSISRSSYSSSGSYSSSNDSDDDDDSTHVTGSGLLVGLGVIFGLLVVVAMGANATTTNDSSNSLYSQGESIADITEIRIAMNADVRPFVQSELMRIAKTCDSKTAAGRLQMFREVTILLRRLRTSWVYGGASDFHPVGMSAAQEIFHRLAANARCKFTHEVIRNVDGATSQQTVSLPTPRYDEGPGLVLVVIVAAARTDFFTVNKVGDGEELRQALDAASNRSAEDLVAIEIIWQPAVTDDRLSSVELEAKYPPPALIKLANSNVGRTVCSFCAGPYPLELLTCPHCGARSHSLK
jgi:uncharacterized membrane protein